jgi:DNA-binding GntR family transcriptional regulator
MTETGAGVPWRRIRDDIAAGIADGRWPIGATLPSYRELSTRYGVSLGPVQRAIRELRDQGALRGEPGVEVVVVADPNQTSPTPDVPLEMLATTVNDHEARLGDHDDRISTLEMHLRDLADRLGQPRPGETPPTQKRRTS